MQSWRVSVFPRSGLLHLIWPTGQSLYVVMIRKKMLVTDGSQKLDSGTADLCKA